MDTLALLIDFGSTFTKVTAVDLAARRVLARAQSPSTVGTDVSRGLLSALGRLKAAKGAPASLPDNLESLDEVFVRASSSAAGGLRMVVAGLVPGLTVQAANAAALNAGAKVVGTFGFKLGEEEIAEIAALEPDMILLTGGTDGGDAATISHNAAAIARSRLSAPVVVAGNVDAAGRVRDLLADAGKEVRVAANVMPAAGAVAPAAAQSEIRALFMRRITDAKGLDRIKSRVPVVLPTPMAVQKAADLGARGIEGRPGRGELLLVDVGGATTDVYSVGAGKPRGKDIIPAGLPEPFVKRTVEGDLGIRYNARTILAHTGAEALCAEFAAVFPGIAVENDALLAYVDSLGTETDRVPEADWQFAADALLARIAVDIAVARHVGRAEPYYASGGAVAVVTGKDMTETPTVIGTGGIFTCNPHVGRILDSPGRADSHGRVLRPRDARVLLDAGYVLYAVGLLADSHPEVALTVFEDHFGPPRQAGEGTHGQKHAHGHGFAPVHEEEGEDPCCG